MSRVLTITITDDLINLTKLNSSTFDQFSLVTNTEMLLSLKKGV